MAKGSTSGGGQVVGLDLSDKRSTFVVLGRRGQVVEEGKVITSRAGLKKQFGGPVCRIAIEAGCHSPWVSRLLADIGHEVIVANPRQVALIAKNQRKTDRLDALRLARLARIDPQLLNPIAHRSQQAQEDLELLRAREQLGALLPPGLRAALDPMLAVISQLRQKIREMDKQVLSLIAERYPAARALMDQLNGVGPFTALASS